MSTLKEMAMMNMEEILYLEGVTTLSHGLDKYLKETPVWSESRLNRISELATNLGSAKLVKQAENILTRYKEILDMLRKRQETLHRAEERLSVGATKHYLCWHLNLNGITFPETLYNLCSLSWNRGALFFVHRIPRIF